MGTFERMSPTSLHPEPSTSEARGPGHGVLAAIGRTPLVDLERYLPGSTQVFAKLELCNPGGSSKSRSAARMVSGAVSTGDIGPDTTVIESTSGNLGIGLAQVCVYYGVDLICVTDARTNPLTIKTMKVLGADVRVVERPLPECGDLLQTRLKMVQELCREIPDSFWPNQYANPSNPAAHMDGTMREIDEAMSGDIDHLFVATGTAGTIRGCIDYLSREDRSTEVTAVDAEGSVLFGGKPGNRLLPGMGAGRVSEIAQTTRPDRVIRVSEIECVAACRRLAKREGILAGASSGGVLAALEKFEPTLTPDARCVVILADGGAAYLDTVYDDQWVEENLGCDPRTLAEMIED